jgi:hypothetical protein
MGMTRITRRFIAWIACFAMLFGALAPSISQAMSVSRGDTWAEICSAAGIKYVKADAGTPVTKKLMHVEHCPFCATQAGSFALLPASASVSFAALEAPNTHPILFYRSPRPLSIWSTAQSRAPPAQA